jgi:hypothetical protein
MRNIKRLKIGNIATFIWLSNENMIGYALLRGKCSGSFNVPRIPSICRVKRVIRSKLNKALDYATQRTVYYYFESTDCDHTSVGYPIKYKNIQTAIVSINDAYDNAEGATYFSRITKAEYDENERYNRDLVLEAHEDGHPYNIHY